MVTENGMGYSDCGGSWIWAFLIFALLGGGGFGFGANRYGGEQLATSADVQRGFDTNEITRKLDGITNGLSDGFYAQNTNMLTGFCNIKENLWNEGRAIQSQIADCCCTTQRAIDSVKYDNLSNTQKILDVLAQNKIEALQGKVNQLELQNALCGVVRYPNAMTFNAGNSPFCGGNSCGGYYC